MQLLELARNAQRLFVQQEPRQKRRLLNFVLSNCSWDDGEVIATFRQPFDLFAETTAISAGKQAAATAISGKSEIWLDNRKDGGGLKITTPTINFPWLLKIARLVFLFCAIDRAQQCQMLQRSR